MTLAAPGWDSDRVDMGEVGVDLLRLVILFTGVTLAAACMKFAWLACRNGEAFRSWGLASYGFLVLTPAIVGMRQFEAPLVVPATITYVVGLVCGIMALRTAYTVSPDWIRLRAADRRRRRERENRAR